MTRDFQFPFKEFEPKWQQKWEDDKVFKAHNPGPGSEQKKKYYILDMFPYPSGAGLHVGHPEGYTATDIIARYKRMKGMNVLHPMGWDAFGLPAEQYAIQTGTHPKITTQKNISNFTKQIKRLGFSYDWDREVDTTSSNYFKWTQWIFLKLFEKGLAYEAEAPVWWCEELGCVLANEEVVDGKSERGQHPVVRRPMRQWMLKITAYADRLLDGLDQLGWPEAIKEMQRNWIGKSIGAEVDFVTTSGQRIRVFTTRPDTLFGATYMVLSPEHPLISEITSAEQQNQVEDYQRQASLKSELERTELDKDKTGVFTGGYAVNPVNQEKIPIWIADYVLASYGTGAIMAVPAHDQRDFDFAKKYQLPIRQVITKEEVGGTEEMSEAFSDDGISIESDFLNGLKTAESKKCMIEWLEEKGCGSKAINYKLRDWLFSRQRYWGEPIPIIHCDDCGVVPLEEKDLPLELPQMEDFKPPKNGDPPLSKATDWMATSCPKCNKKAIRETNTMPQWAGSCWYYLRYIDPSNDQKFLDSDLEKYWMNVDLYVGGAEHAVLHLLYSRFWHKVLFDLGYVSTEEPFQKLVNQGIILGEDGQKMSKSKGNVVNPDDVIDEYGADSMRLFEMFMGPLEQSKSWSMTGVQGVNRFLTRVWRLFIGPDGEINKDIKQAEPNEVECKSIHKLIAKVSQDLDRMAFNTAISAFMIFLNEETKLKEKSQSVLEAFLILLSPFAPHIAEELWNRLGKKSYVCNESWPRYEEKYLQESEIEMPVQVNGKIKARLMVSVDLDQNAIRDMVLKNSDVEAAIQGREIVRAIVVPKRLVNLVVK